MTENISQKSETASKFSLSEDWLATFAGLGIVLIIALGTLGPGPQKITLSAGSGESERVNALAISGWSISLKIDDVKEDPVGFPAALDEDQAYSFTCNNDEISVVVTDTANLEGKALLSLTNNCAGEVTIIYETEATIPWPLFRIFD